MSAGPIKQPVVPPLGVDDGGESILSGYSREEPTRPEKFEKLAQRAPGAHEAVVTEELPETGGLEVDEPSEEMIDEAIEESFPASDPPSYPGSSGETVLPRTPGEEASREA